MLAISKSPITAYPSVRSWPGPLPTKRFAYLATSCLSCLRVSGQRVCLRALRYSRGCSEGTGEPRQACLPWKVVAYNPCQEAAWRIGSGNARQGGKVRYHRTVHCCWRLFMSKSRMISLLGTWHLAHYNSMNKFRAGCFGKPSSEGDIDLHQNKRELGKPNSWFRLLMVLFPNANLVCSLVLTPRGMDSYKEQKENDRRARAGDSAGWNASFVRADTVVDALADRLGVGKSDILDREEVSWRRKRPVRIR